MPIGAVLEDVFCAVMKRGGRIDSRFRRRAFVLIRACRKLQVDYHNVKDPQAVLQLMRNIDHALKGRVDEGSSSQHKDLPDKFGCALHEEDFSRLYADHQKALAEWKWFSETFDQAAQHDENCTKMIRDLKECRHKSTVWPFGKQKNVEMTFVLFPEQVYGDKPRRSTLIKRELRLHTSESNFEEVIWLFSRAKGENRITLQQNAQFYDLTQLWKNLDSNRPLSPLDEPKRRQHEYHILIDRPIPVMFESPEPRVFGNVWRSETNRGERVFFKEFNGALWDNRTIRSTIRANSFYADNDLHQSLTWDDAVNRALSDLERADSRQVTNDSDTIRIYKIISTDPHESPPTSDDESWRESLSTRSSHLMPERSEPTEDSISGSPTIPGPPATASGSASAPTVAFAVPTPPTVPQPLVIVTQPTPSSRSGRPMIATTHTETPVVPTVDNVPDSDSSTNVTALHQRSEAGVCGPRTSDSTSSNGVAGTTRPERLSATAPVSDPRRPIPPRVSQGVSLPQPRPGWLQRVKKAVVHVVQSITGNN